MAVGQREPVTAEERVRGTEGTSDKGPVYTICFLVRRRDRPLRPFAVGSIFSDFPF